MMKVKEIKRKIAVENYRIKMLEEYYKDKEGKLILNTSSLMYEIVNPGEEIGEGYNTGVKYTHRFETTVRMIIEQVRFHISLYREYETITEILTELNEFVIADQVAVLYISEKQKAEEIIRLSEKGLQCLDLLKEEEMISKGIIEKGEYKNEWRERRQELKENIERENEKLKALEEHLKTRYDIDAREL